MSQKSNATNIMIPQRYKRMQELLDEIIGPATIVRESNSEVVWRLWDEAVAAQDQRIPDGKPRVRNLGTFGYPLDSFVDGTELK